jgi:hypothetical protein
MARAFRSFSLSFREFHVESAQSRGHDRAELPGMPDPEKEIGPEPQVFGGDLFKNQDTPDVRRSGGRLREFLRNVPQHPGDGAVDRARLVLDKRHPADIGLVNDPRRNDLEHRPAAFKPGEFGGARSSSFFYENKPGRREAEMFKKSVNLMLQQKVPPVILRPPENVLDPCADHPHFFSPERAGIPAQPRGLR